MTADEARAQDDAWGKQYDDEQAAKKAQEVSSGQPPSPLQQFGSPPARVTHSMLDSVLSEAEAWGTAVSRVGRSAAAGAITGTVNIADAAGSAITSSARGLAMAEDPAHADAAATGEFPTSPLWDHAKGAILDFRDAVAVQDPNLVDTLTQGAAQLVIPFAGYSRLLSGVHGFANMVVAGAATDATALAPHDPRLADLIALGRTTDRKLGQVLRAHGTSALNGYISYLTSGHAGATPEQRARDESEAEGRFKNVLDGFGANLIVTPLLMAAARVLKHGTAGLRYLADNGVGSASELGPAPAVAQRGGPAAAPSAARPAPRQITHEVEGGEHRLTSASGGYTHGQDVGRDIEVSTSFTPATARRQGEGTSRLETLARAAHDRGGVLRSGTTVSAAQASNYAQLEKRGYDVHRNAEATRNPETRGWLSGDPKLPVFVVRPRRSAAVGE